MKKILLTLTLLTHFSFSATPEQVEQYLSVSNAEEQLIAMQEQYSTMQNQFTKDTNTSGKTYDMQMLSIRFKDYIQRHLSENEMEEVLESYRNVILLQFISAESNIKNLDKNETSVYLERLKANPEAGTRIEVIQKISKALYSKEAMLIMFDDLLIPMMRNSMGSEKINDDMLKEMKKNYIKEMSKSANDATLITCKDFTMEELDSLLEIAQTPSIEHEVKAVFGAMSYALKEFFMSLSSRYNIEKHQSTSNNITKQNEPTQVVKENKQVPKVNQKIIKENIPNEPVQNESIQNESIQNEPVQNK